MVASSGGYYGADFKGYRGVTHGDPLYPTIFNLVVDVVVRHWVAVIVDGAEERGKRGKDGRNHNALFYMDDGMVASPDPQWLQGEFSTLVGLFYRVGLQTNVGKTAGMFFRPCHAARTQLEATYGQQMTGEGPSYWERQKGRVQCRECGEEMVAGLMAGHTKTQHGR